MAEPDGTVNPEYVEQRLEKIQELKESLAVFEASISLDFFHKLRIQIDNLRDALKKGDPTMISIFASGLDGYYDGIMSVSRKFLAPADEIAE
ncbi:MAG: hypothetical protein NTW11_03515 [Candidatus Staskawiczbacteria bacterium]|nr:hypothetical protein [Candidatus Staskawiczbacteria bacterium]